MEKDLEKELKDILDKHEKDKKCECSCLLSNTIPPFYEPNNSDWILALVALGMLGDTSKNDFKQPIINIYLGGDK